MILLLVQAEAAQSAAQARWALWGDYALADPLMLAALPLALLAYLLGRRRAFGRISVTGGVPRSARARFAWVPSVLQLAAVVCATLALARPLRSNVEHDVRSEGVDIALVIDRSGSMQFEDLEQGKSRLAVVKEVVGEFARRRMTDRDNAADNVALISFAHYPRMLCPFTLDVDALMGFLDKVELAKREEEDGTAIGVGLAKAVSVLRESDAKSRVCVLLTDGENNIDDITPAAATELAAEERIKVYTIYAARYLFQYDPFQGWRPTRESADTSALEQMAAATGGRFYRAADKAELEKIYAEIETLERTPRSEQRFEETYDLYPWFLFPALLCALGAQLGRASVWRRLS
ncbi:MAG: VWA domain-containing protein [Planctomycetes bacterium]|nr:VWA domain-containing protein [Planctomycetota bacterium]